MQETNLKNLVINKVESQEVYDSLKTNGKIQSDELYLVGGGSSVDSVNGQTGDVSLDIPVVHKVESQDAYDEMITAGQVNAGELYLVQGDDAVQPDWSQNDETAEDYIKNRPGGYSTSNSSTTTLNITNSTKISDGKYSIMGNDFVYQSDSGFVNVEYDGTLYEDVPVSDPDAYGGYAFGDQSLTKYPFYFNSSAYLGGGNYSCIAYVTKENPVVKVTSWHYTYAKIPSNYLDLVQPDWQQYDDSADDFIKNKPTKLLRYEVDSLATSDQKVARSNINVPQGGYMCLEEGRTTVLGRFNISTASDYVYNMYAYTSYILLKPDSVSYMASKSYNFDSDNPGFTLESPQELIPTEDTKNIYVLESGVSNPQLYYITSFHKKTDYGLEYEGVKINKYASSALSNINDYYPGYAFVVGNGLNTSNRSNAHTLDWNGNAWFSGDVYTGSTNGVNRDDGSKKLATEEYVDGKISDKEIILASSTSGSTKKFKITVDDNGTISATEI